MNDDLVDVLETVSDPVILADLAWTIVHANSAANALFGYRLPGVPLIRAIRQPDAVKTVRAVLADGHARQTELPMGEPAAATYRLSVRRLSGVSLNDAAVAIAMKDIAQEEAVERLRSDFVANVSHELRSPLTTLTGIVETLSGSAADDRDAQQRFLGIMSEEASRMERLIDDLISLSRVEADERVRPTQNVDLVALIESVLTIIRERAEAANRILDFDHVEPTCMALGDEDQLRQVFLNLLENAVRYSQPGGPVRITIARRARSPVLSDPSWTIAVRDEGEGIAREHLPRLTERFYRVDAGRSRQVGGTGLGLAIVKHIVNRHRGRLSFASDRGEGTVATVILPIAE